MASGLTGPAKNDGIQVLYLGRIEVDPCRVKPRSCSKWLIFVSSPLCIDDIRCIGELGMLLTRPFAGLLQVSLGQQRHAQVTGLGSRARRSKAWARVAAHGHEALMRKRIRRPVYTMRAAVCRSR